MIKDKKTLRKMDTVAGIILCALALFFGVVTYKMPWNGISGGGVKAAPGILPIIVCGALFIMGILLAVEGYKEGGKITGDDIKAGAKVLVSKEALRIYLMIVLIAGYIFGLLGRIHFAIATFIFLSVFFLVVKAGKWWSCLLLAAIVAGAITFAFGELIGIPLP